MPVTRRTLASGLAVSLGLGALGLPALQRAVTPDHAQILQRELDALALRLAPETRLQVTGFEITRVPEGVEMVAHIRMTWAPGERQCPYGVVAIDADLAFGKIRDKIVANIVQLHHPDAGRWGGSGSVA